MAAKPTPAHKWEFKARFRRNAFGWQSQPAIARIKEAIKEILAVSREEPIVAADGAVIFLEKISPALTHVDGSSGAIGSAVNRAIEKLVPVIADAPVDDATREKLLERLLQACNDDQISYIESLANHWGQLCASKERASAWADRFIGTTQYIYGPDSTGGGYYPGTSFCLSALLKAERYDELETILSWPKMDLPFYQEYRVKALIAREKGIEAIEMSNKRVRKPLPLPQPPATAEDYRAFLRQTEMSGSYLNRFKSAVKRFSDIAPAQILEDLIATTPGAESKWFAAAKELKDFELAVRLAYKSPCDPRTLTKASSDFKDINPVFAAEVGLAAIHWLIKGHGLNIERYDIQMALSYTMAAAKLVGQEAQAIKLIDQMLIGKSKSSNVYQVLTAQLAWRR